MYVSRAEGAALAAPCFRSHDGPNWIDDSVPDDVLAHWNLEKSLMDQAGNRLRRWLLKRWIGG